MLTWHDNHATIIRLTDATERTCELGHFAGRGLCFLNIPRCDHSELRIDPRLARELATILSHFADFRQLPHRPTAPDYSI